MSDYDDLAQLIALAAHPVPSLAGAVGQPTRDQLVCGDADNPARLVALHGALHSRHQEAGPHYWGVRAWSLLIWQPIYLSLLAVHLAHRAPFLRHMGQSVSEGFVGGYRLPAHQPERGVLDELIRFAASEVSGFIERQLAEFNSVLNIYPKLARLLMVDCVRDALLLVQRQLGLDCTQLLGLEQRWLAALAQPTASGLISVRLDDGRECLALERRACCQHFRRLDGELCATCPKRKPGERLSCLRKEMAGPC